MSEWIKTNEQLPPRKPNIRYSQVRCLVCFKNKEIGILTFNHEHMVWDQEDGDDFYCHIGEVPFWMPLPEPPRE